MSTDDSSARVGVYIDFDNIVISRYDQVHGDGAWRKDNARDAGKEVTARLVAARVDVSALLDYASSFGTLARRIVSIGKRGFANAASRPDRTAGCFSRSTVAAVPPAHTSGGSVSIDTRVLP